jgi:hypothetical protein
MASTTFMRSERAAHAHRHLLPEQRTATGGRTAGRGAAVTRGVVGATVGVGSVVTGTLVTGAASAGASAVATGALADVGGAAGAIDARAGGPLVAATAVVAVTGATLATGDRGANVG